MNRYVVARTRPPVHARFGTLVGIGIVAALIALPFYWVWHPLGKAVLLIVYAAIWIPLWWAHRGDRPTGGVSAHAEAKVTIRRG